MTNASPLDVVVTGLNVVDVLVPLPAMVVHGAKHEVCDVLVQGGAPAGNAVCVLAALGWQAGFVTRLGDDSMSLVARAELTRFGVREDLFIHDPAASAAVAVVEIDSATGERTVFYSLAGYRRLRAEDVPVEVVRTAKLVLVDGYETEAALAALEAAREAGCKSVLDVETGDRDLMKRLLELGSDAILPLAGASELTGASEPEDALRRLAEWTGAQLIVTDGSRGSWAWTGEGMLHQAAFEVKAVDTTGCGDAFHGAYASALLDGWPLSLRMEFAAYVASRVALKLGGRSNLPTRASLLTQDLSPLSPDLRERIRARGRAEVH